MTGPYETRQDATRAYTTVKQLLIAFELLKRSGELLDDWKKANVTPIFKEGKK